MNRYRHNYRKNLKVDGSLVIGSSEISFVTKDVSLNGFHACCTNAENLENGDIVFVRLPKLSIEGVASTIWKEADQHDVFNIGFKFLNMRGVRGSAYHYRESEQRVWAG